MPVPTTVIVIAAFAMAALAAVMVRGRALQERREARPRIGVREGLSLKLRPISAWDQNFFATAWGYLHGGFLDDPALSLSSAEQLVTRLLDVRGYPEADQDEHLVLLPAEHAGTLADYRAARLISRNAREAPAGTPPEDLCRALVSCHAFFTELLLGSDGAVGPRRLS